MGNEQPRKPNKASKGQIEIACMKTKFHLEMMKNRTDAKTMAVEKELVTKIRSKNRNKVEEILLAESIVNGLKYAQACSILMTYAASLKLQSTLLADCNAHSMYLEPCLVYIYSLIYAADHLGLFSLNEFKAAMNSLNDPVLLPAYANYDIVKLLGINPSPYDVNNVMLLVAYRNEISLEEINAAGHNVRVNTGRQVKDQINKDIGYYFSIQFRNSIGSQGGNGQGGEGFGIGKGGQGGYGGSGGQVVYPRNTNIPSTGTNPYGDISNIHYVEPPKPPVKTLQSSSLTFGPPVVEPTESQHKPTLEKPKYFPKFDPVLKYDKPSSSNLYPYVSASSFKPTPYVPAKLPMYQMSFKDYLNRL